MQRYALRMRSLGACGQSLAGSVHVKRLFINVSFFLRIIDFVYNLYSLILLFIDGFVCLLIFSKYKENENIRICLSKIFVFYIPSIFFNVFIFLLSCSLLLSRRTRKHTHGRTQTRPDVHSPIMFTIRVHTFSDGGCCRLDLQCTCAEGPQL